MEMVYPVIFTETNDEKNTVLIEVPDWSILTEGFGMADAINMARDAIGLKAIYYEDKNKMLPEPSGIYDIDSSDGAFAKDGESCVTIPNWLNQEAEKANINVSKVLQNALMEVLGVKKSRKEKCFNNLDKTKSVQYSCYHSFKIISK